MSSTTRTEDLTIKCNKMSLDNGIMELEDVDVKALLISLVNKIGLYDLLDYATDTEDDNFAHIVNFIDTQYDMESAINELDAERQEEIKEYLK